MTRALPPLPPRLPPPEIDPDRLDVDSLKVVARLRRHGHEAYLVGGCVRDLLAGARPKDYDVATSARPEEIRQVFQRNSRLIGRRFRLAHVYFPGGRLVEVATFRSTPVQAAADEDGEPTGDLLLTDDNQFGTAEEDARRRDFTINALFYDVQAGRLLDFVGGRADLEAHVVRTIGDPEIRLREDPVRGLRAARIAAKLGFQVAPETFAAMVRHAGELPRCAAARVLEETLKLLRSGASRTAFRILHDAQILRVLLPPVAEVLEQGGEEAQERLFARLGALDALVAEGRGVTDPVMLATLLAFLPLHHDPHDAPEGAGFDEEPVAQVHSRPSADKVLAQMSATARLPRRIADRVRAILSAQKLFREAHRKKRGRRGGSGFVRTPHFAEALLFFEIDARATGQHLELVDRWKERAVEAAKAVDTRGAQSDGGPDDAEQSDAAEAGPGEGRESDAAPAAVHAEGADAGPSAERTRGASGGAEDGAPPRKRRRRGGRRRRKPAPDGSSGAPPPSGEPTP